MSTIFQQIIDRTVPADIIYEDDRVVAFLDISPIRKGHALIIPKQQYVDIFDIDPEVFAHMAKVAQLIARALMSAVSAKGVNIHMNNRAEAGQDIFHAHMHVVPRFARGEAFEQNQHESYEDGESAHIAGQLRSALQGST